MTSAKKTLRIALVSTAKGWHGGEGQLAEMARGFRRRGHDCLILAQQGETFAARMTDEGFSVVEFPGKGRSPAALWKIRQTLRQWRPDVVHYNDAHAVTAAGFASIRLDIPARFGSRRVDFPVRSAAKYTRFCDRVLCVSNGVADVCRAGGIPDELLRVVHEGVDPARVRSGDRQRGRQSLGLCEDQTMLLTVATLTDHKGHRYLLDAMPGVLEKNRRVQLMLAGDGELRESLVEQTRRLGIESSVRFLGYRDDVPDLIHGCDLFILPSHLEGLCTSLIDVMLAARPIVATTAGGIPDLVGPGDDGEVAWTVPPQDSDALQSAVLEAISASDEADARRQRACRRAESRFTAECMIDNMLSVFHEQLAAGRPSFADAA